MNGWPARSAASRKTHPKHIHPGRGAFCAPAVFAAGEMRLNGSKGRGQRARYHAKLRLPWPRARTPALAPVRSHFALLRRGPPAPVQNGPELVLRHAGIVVQRLHVFLKCDMLLRQRVFQRKLAGKHAVRVNRRNVDFYVDVQRLQLRMRQQRAVRQPQPPHRIRHPQLVPDHRQVLHKLLVGRALLVQADGALVAGRLDGLAAGLRGVHLSGRGLARALQLPAGAHKLGL